MGRDGPTGVRLLVLRTIGEGEGEGEGGREDAPAPAAARGEQAATGGGSGGENGDEAITEGREQGGAPVPGEGTLPASGQGGGQSEVGRADAPEDEVNPVSSCYCRRRATPPCSCRTWSPARHGSGRAEQDSEVDPALGNGPAAHDGGASEAAGGSIKSKRGQHRT
jgi:hypothetical protein